MIRHRNTQSGMTLMEIMISLTILIAMMGMAWSTFSRSLEIKKSSEASNEYYHELRVAMARMVSDLSSAYISSNEDQSREERRTLFIGKDSTGDVSELRFSSLSHRVLWANANESEQTMIYYAAESDRKDSGKTNLIRRENRRLSDEKWDDEPAEIDVLLRDIKKVEFEYYDWREKEWRKSWDSTQLDGQRGRLPSRVRITVTMEQGDKDKKFVAQARVMLQEELQLSTN